ncbi:MAG: hypothetical protein ACI90V_000793 [Bacillariaceae sp.]|jgi:hypothetical protein
MNVHIYASIYFLLPAKLTQLNHYQVEYKTYASFTLSFQDILEKNIRKWEGQ